MLLGLRPAANGRGPADAAKTKPSVVRTSRPTARVHDRNEVVDIAGRAHVVLRVDVAHARGTDRTYLRADVFAALGGGAREIEAPVGAAVPSVGWWESPSGAKKDDLRVVVGPRQQGTWSVYVPVVDATAVGVEISATTEADS